MILFKKYKLSPHQSDLLDLRLAIAIKDNIRDILYD